MSGHSAAPHRAILGFTLALLMTPALAAAARAGDEVSGPARVLDADILIIDKQRVILWGVDAPERSQTCGADGKLWGCYDAARRALELLSGRGEVRCTLTGEPDPFNRRFGVCMAGDEDIGAELIRQGLALAYSDQTDAYEAIQLEAITAGVGLWQPGVVFEEPWIFRLRNTPGGYR